MKKFLATLNRYFLTGMVVLLPVVLTVYCLIWLVVFADSMLGNFFEPLFYDQFGFYFKGMSIIIGIWIIIVFGFFATNFFGKKIHSLFESILIRLPFFKQVYPALKEMAEFLFARDRFSNFKRAVIIEYPRKGIYVFGFLTNDSSEVINQKTKEELCNVFIPSSPSPITGFVVLVPKEDIIVTDVSVEQVFKFVVSGGVVNPGVTKASRSEKAIPASQDEPNFPDEKQNSDQQELFEKNQGSKEEVAE